QDHERLDLRVFERKGPAENAQRLAVDADEAGGGVVHGLAQNGAQHEAEKADAERPYDPRARSVLGDEPRADHHFTARRLEPLEDPRNVARVVLAVAI